MATQLNPEQVASAMRAPIPAGQPTSQPQKNKSRKKCRIKGWSAKSQPSNTVGAIQNAPPRKIDDAVGYAKVAAFQSSTPNFSLYRGFSYLHSRILLDLQDEIAALEQRLDEHDSDDVLANNALVLKSRERDIRASKEPPKSCNASTAVPAVNTSKERRDTLDAIREKLAQYDDLLLKARDVAALKKPAENDFRSVRTWFHNDKPMVYAEEYRSIQYKEDMISLHQGRDWAAFDGIIVSMLTRLPFLKRILSTADLRSKTNNQYIKLYSPYRIEFLVGIILAPTLCLLLVLPIIALYKLNISHERLASWYAIIVLVCFTLVFAASMPFFTKAGRNEVFAAAAAYCAVLVVFISNFGTNNTTGKGANG